MASINVLSTRDQFFEPAQSLDENDVLALLEVGRSDVLDWLPGPRDCGHSSDTGQWQMLTAERDLGCCATVG
jgi:hypothetical protein